MVSTDSTSAAAEPMVSAAMIGGKAAGRTGGGVVLGAAGCGAHASELSFG
ncbi:hypothetical protein [Nocardia sp. A7]